MSAKLNFSCHGCEERKPGCHSTCERYKDDLATLKQLNKEERLKGIPDTYKKSYHVRSAVVDAKSKLKKDRYYTKGKMR